MLVNPLQDLSLPLFPKLIQFLLNDAPQQAKKKKTTKQNQKKKTTTQSNAFLKRTVTDSRSPTHFSSMVN